MTATSTAAGSSDASPAGATARGRSSSINEDDTGSSSAPEGLFPPRKSSLATLRNDSRESSPLMGASDDAPQSADPELSVSVDVSGSIADPVGSRQSETRHSLREPTKFELGDIPEAASPVTEAFSKGRDAPSSREVQHAIPEPVSETQSLKELDFDFGDLTLNTYDAALQEGDMLRPSTGVGVAEPVAEQIDVPTIISTSPPAEARLRPTSKAKSSHSIFASRIRRRSWISASRSPSPKKSEQKKAAPVPADEPEDEPLTMSSTRNEISAPLASASRPSSSHKSPSFSKQFASRLRKRPSQGSTLETVPDESLHLRPSESTFFGRMHKSASEDKLSIPALIPSTRSSDRLSSFAQPDGLPFTLTTKSRQARKRDELWAAFRDLEGACQRFTSKHLDQKGSVLRTSLLPFLQEHETHPSNTRLHPEDLDRRTAILHRWWMSLLDFVRSRIFPLAANGTRAMALDSIVAIMERPEWRQFPSPFTPAVAKKSSDAISESNSANSEHEYLVESAQHNARNYFSQCLLSQMTFVIEKMSSRAAPSLVAFCGKSCAYAFFFCPGIAALLIHLWRSPADLLNRVLQESAVSLRNDSSAINESLSSALPPTLKEVQFTSLASALKISRTLPPFPVGTENVAWKGAWVDKWTGQDSDLFYVFVRQYYILLHDYLPEASKAEQIFAAGGLFVQAQVLANMNATIKRLVPKSAEFQSQPPPANFFKSSGFVGKDGLPDDQRKVASITFDDVLADPESTASLVPFAPNNADRVMAENRLIMLLRDMLVTYSSEIPAHAQESFAHLFANLMRAVAKTTPQFNRFASEALCDFVEEAVVIFVRYEQTHSLHSSFMDWSFWFEVWRKMASSNNYFTEMKVYSTLYTIWPTIALENNRKSELCNKFLLDKDHFESRFSHWSPMVRAYYMRLLAWRVARCSEDVTEDELKVVELLADRLLGVYGNYLYLREQGKAPNTSPSNPAPGRRFIIVRADHTQSTRSGPLITFDAPSTPHNAAYKRSLMLEQLCSPDISAEDRPVSAMSFASSNASDSDRDIDDSPKRWTGGLLRGIMGTTKPKGSQSPSRPSNVRAASAPALRPSSKQSSIQERIDLVTKPSAQAFPAYRTYCFRFSLELVDRRMGAPASMQLQIPRLPQPAQLLLTRYLRGLSLTAEASDDEEAAAPVSADNASADTADSTATPAENASSVGSDEQAVSTINVSPVWNAKPVPPTGQGKLAAPYCGRALAEWTVLVSECHMFFERRKAEGVPGNRWVETPLLGTEVLRRPL